MHLPSCWRWPVPNCRVMGITAVAGNAALKLTEKNARKICELAGSRRPVFAGAIRPLVRPLVTAEEVHGKTMASTVPTCRNQNAAAEAIRGRLHCRDADVSAERNRHAVRLGPLTNIALALIREPKIAGRIKEIVLMGGGFFEGGNVTPTAEFNIYVDPHAADIVFRSGVAIVAMPLDVTHKALTTSKRIAAFRELAPGRHRDR